MPLRTILASLLLLLPLSPASAAVIRVPADVPTIQQALTAASDGDIIEISPGTWTGPFTVTKGVRLRGMGTSPEDVILRVDPSSTLRIMVVTGTNDAIIENLAFHDAPAGALGIATLSSASLFSVVFRDNFSPIIGGAISLINGNATISDCVFIDNIASGEGGAIAMTGVPNGSNLFLSNTVFRGNQSSQGAVRVFHGNATIQNCLFEDNIGLLAASDIFGSTDSVVDVRNSILTGGNAISAIRLGDNASMTLTNVTAADHVGGTVGLINGFTTASASIRNSIIRFDEGLPLASGPSITVRYSNVTGGFTGPGNQSGDPLFRSGTLYQLDAGSPCIDAADSAVMSAPLDYSGNPRFVDDQNIPNTGAGSLPILDMGALERVPAIRYVRASASGFGNGLSWNDAMTDLQDALDAAASGNVEEIWIAAGTYRPDRGTGDRSLSFVMRNNLEIIGGFSGVETRRDDRNPGQFPAILGGAIGQPGVADNTFHVIRANNLNASAVLRDVIVQRGNAEGSPSGAGGGILVNGGNPRFRNITVRLCEGAGEGAAIATLNSAATFGGMRVLRNGLESAPSGIITFIGGSPLLLNSLIHGNSAADNGTIRLLDNAGARIVNCTVVGNTTGGLFAGIFKDAGLAEVHNSILWNNTPLNPFPGQAVWLNNLRPDGADVRFTTIEGYPTDVMLGLNGRNPRFVNPLGADGIAGTADDDYRLAAGSCLIDSAKNDLLPPGASTDLQGAPRFVDDPGTMDSGVGIGPIVDRGAFEFQDATLCQADLNGDGVVDLADLLIVLSSWGTCGSACTADLDCDGIVNLSDLLSVLSAWGPC